MDKEKTAYYLGHAKESAVATAEGIADILKNGGTKEEAFKWFSDRFYHGYIRDIYPIDAMELNTGITVDLINRELIQTHEEH